LHTDDQELEGNYQEVSSSGMRRDVSDLDTSQNVTRKWTANIDDNTSAAAGSSPFDFNFTSFDNNLFSGFESNMFDNEWHQFLESTLTDLNTATVDSTM
jgi:hypothetical protein